MLFYFNSFGDNKDADFVYTDEAEAIFLRRAALASGGDATWGR